MQAHGGALQILVGGLHGAGGQSRAIEIDCAVPDQHEQYRDRGLVVLGVNFQERDDEITAFLSQVGVTFPSLVDRTGEVSRQWRATGLPTTFLIDRQGIIRDVRVGAFTEGMLEERLTKVLGE